MLSGQLHVLAGVEPHQYSGGLASLHGFPLPAQLVTVFHFCGWPTVQVRRRMEQENQKARRAARREYNEQVRELVAFVRKRDKRVAARQVEEARLREAREQEERERWVDHSSVVGRALCRLLRRLPNPTGGTACGRGCTADRAAWGSAWAAGAEAPQAAAAADPGGGGIRSGARARPD